MAVPGALDRKGEPEDAGQAGTELVGVAAAGGVEAIEAAQLSEPDSGGDVRHPEVVPEHAVVVALALPMLPESANRGGDRGVVGGYEAALPRGHVLGRIEREDRGVTQGTNFGAVHRSAVRLACIFDGDQRVAARNVGELRHRRRVSI